MPLQSEACDKLLYLSFTLSLSLNLIFRAGNDEELETYWRWLLQFFNEDYIS